MNAVNHIALKSTGSHLNTNAASDDLAGTISISATTSNFHTLSFASSYAKNSWPSLAVSPTDGNVYVVYADQPNKTAGAEVEYIVNNAGFGVFGRAIQRDRSNQLEIIAVNVRALTDLSLRFSDHLIRHRGGLLNVGSIAGFLPGPGMAVYYASKAYVLSFTEAMRAELAPHGVRVTVVCPGPVPSEFQARAGFKPGFDSAILNVSPADVAQQAYSGLMANKRAVLPGLGIKIVPFLLRLFPRSFILGAVGRFQLRQR